MMLRIVGATAVALLSLTALAPAAGVRRLPYSTASNRVVQRQPAPGSCHAIGRGLYVRPDPRCTPGALNPQVRQATIGRTICRSGWTATVRPPESVTEREKYASMAAYGDGGGAHAYEYDHFVPLELGGATNDARNLWPEPGATPNPKDAVENRLKRAVCDGSITLARAQQEMVSDWVTLARGRSSGPRTPARPRSSARPPAARRGAWCSAYARYSVTYHDYDVYVRSDQPDRDVTVSGDGRTATWHTDGSGSADVYLHAGRGAAGDALSVRVGAATCGATL